jgi:hypothetical protein
VLLLSRRQVHAVLTGAGATLAYLAAAEAGSKRPVRVGGLLLLSTAAMAGMAASRAGTQASVKARLTETRLGAHITATAPAINFVNNGGTVGGNVTVAGDHHVNGDHTVSGNIDGGGHMQVPGNISNVGGSGNVNTDGSVNAGGDVSTGPRNNIGSYVNGLPNWVFPSVKCGTVTSVSGSSLGQVNGCLTNVIQSLKAAGHM